MVRFLDPSFRIILLSYYLACNNTTVCWYCLLMCNAFRVESLWLSNKILPIINGMLPRVPKARQVARARSSCDTSFLIVDKLSAVDVPAQTSSHMEMYEHKDDLWAEMEELEIDPKLNQEVDTKSSNYNDQIEWDHSYLYVYNKITYMYLNYYAQNTLPAFSVYKIYYNFI